MGAWDNDKVKIIKLKNRSHEKLNSLRGHNGCKTYEDVIDYLYMIYLKEQEKQK